MAIPSERLSDDPSISATRGQQSARRKIPRHDEDDQDLRSPCSFGGGAALPAHLPAATRRAARDQRIKVLGRELAAAIPGTTRHAIAQMIASAGAALDRGHRTAARELPMLTGAELAVVEGEILTVLEWLSMHHDGTRWPRVRQIFAILTH